MRRRPRSPFRCRGAVAVVAVLSLAGSAALACSVDRPGASGDDPDGGPTATEPASVLAGGAEAASTAPPGGGESIQLGVIMAATGRVAAIDAPALHALRYAVRQVNAAGGLLGRPLELLFRDSESDLNVAYQEALRLAEREVPVIFATCDAYFARPIMDAAQDAGVLVITPCGPEPRLADIFVLPLAFSARTAAAGYGRAMAEHLAERRIFSVALLQEADNAEAVRICSAFNSRFTELGGTVRFNFSFDRNWLAGVPAADRSATARTLRPAGDQPMVVLCAGVGGRGPEFFRLLRELGVAAPALAPAALDGVVWRAETFGVEPLRVVTEASTYGDDPSGQVNAYFAALVLGDDGGDGGDAPAGEASGGVGAAADEPWPGVDDRLGWAVTGAEALWAFIRAVQRTGSFDPFLLARDLERFRRVELWMGPAGFGPERHAVIRRPLRIIEHSGGGSRLVELRVPTQPGDPAPAPSTQ